MQNYVDCIQYLNVNDTINGYVILGQGTAYLDGGSSCLNMFKI